MRYTFVHVKRAMSRCGEEDKRLCVEGRRREGGKEWQPLVTSCSYHVVHESSATPSLSLQAPSHTPRILPRSPGDAATEPRQQCHAHPCTSDNSTQQMPESVTAYEC